MPPRVRFAPSPTGYLHIGGARTALFNWLHARRLGGVFILRIEDTDPERSRPEYERQILDAMAWLGLDWDEGPERGGAHGPYRQSARMALYDQYIDQLLAQGKAYRCNMTAAELDALREQQRSDGVKPRYDRRNRDANLGPGCGRHGIRLKMPLTGSVVVEDTVKGRVVFDAAELDDWVIRRTDGSPTYNFVVVIDDHEMAITDVIRGDDHLNNTPKQQCLYDALGWDAPRFAHLPMILNPDGKRISKRDRDVKTSVDEYRTDGILPEALINYLTRLGWAHGEMEAFSTEESIPVFTLKAVNKTGARWDMDKLLWLNQHWLKRLPAAELAERARPFFTVPTDERLPAVVATLAERSRTLVELAEKGAFFFVADEALEHDPAAVKKFLKGARGPELRELIARLEAVQTWETTALQEVVEAFLAEKGMKLSKIAQPVRVSLTGERIGPGLYETLNALGKSASLARLARGAALCEARIS